MDLVRSTTIAQMDEAFAHCARSIALERPAAAAETTTTTTSAWRDYLRARRRLLRKDRGASYRIARARAATRGLRRYKALAEEEVAQQMASDALRRALAAERNERDGTTDRKRRARTLREDAARRPKDWTRMRVRGRVAIAESGNGRRASVVRFSPTSPTIFAVGFRRGDVEIFEIDPEGDAAAIVRCAAGGRATDLDFDRAGRFLLGASDDRTVRLWTTTTTTTTTTSRRRRRLATYCADAPVAFARFRPRDNNVVVVATALALRVVAIDRDGFRATTASRTLEAPFAAAAFAEDELVVADASGVVSIRDAATLATTRTWRRDEPPRRLFARPFDLTVDDRTLLSLDARGRVRVARLDDGRTFCSFDDDDEVTALAPCVFSDQTIAGTRRGALVALAYDADGRARATTIRRRSGVAVEALAWNLDETRLLVANAAGRVALWTSEEATTTTTTTKTGEDVRRDDLARVGARHFNRDPTGAWPALEREYGLVRSDAPIDRARFLLRAPGLDPAVVGRALADPAFADVLRAYATESVAEGGVEFETALRDFLSRVRPPGEPERMERVLRAFARAFHRANAFACRSETEVFVLAFAAIVLNTDLVAGRRRRRTMRAGDFVRTVRGVPGGADVSEARLRRLYASVKRRPLKVAAAAGGVEDDDGGVVEVSGVVECPVCQRPIRHRDMMAHVETMHGAESAPCV